MSRDYSPAVVAPKYVVQAANMLQLDDELFAEQIVVTDFGQSFFVPKDAVEHEQRQVGTPCGYCAPELLFNGFPRRAASFQSDVWALACTMYEIRAGYPLFETFIGQLNDILRQMVEMLGKLPEPWWSV